MRTTCISGPPGAAFRGERGGALLAVLWLSAALGVISFTLASTVRGEVERTSTAIDGTRAYYLAQGAIQQTILHMFWSRQNPSLAQRYYVPGAPLLRFTYPSGAAEVRIIPETAKLNVNNAPAEELFRLMGALGVEPGRAREIVMAILDWRTPATPGGMGGFDGYYLSLTPSFRAPHASLQETEELLMVKGITPDLFYGTWEAPPQADGRPRLVPRAGLNDCLSVFGSDHIDVNASHPAVLAAIGIPPDSIAAIVQRRSVKPFLSSEELQPFMQAAGPAGGRLRYGGNSIYTLRATAGLWLPTGQLSDMRRTVGAMVKFMPAGYDAHWHILRWYDTAWTN